jgi:hypothetical protein
MDNGLTHSDHDLLIKVDQRLLVIEKCCDEVEKKLDASQTRGTATLTTVIILLITTVINLVLYYAK